MLEVLRIIGAALILELPITLCLIAGVICLIERRFEEWMKDISNFFAR